MGSPTPTTQLTPPDQASPTYTFDDALRAFAPDDYGSITSAPSAAIARLTSKFGPLSSPSFDPVSALFYAIDAGYSAAVSLLLAPPYNVDPNCLFPTTDEDADNHGKTPLHMAAQAGDLATTKILLQAGVNPIATREPSHNHTPLDVALCRGRREIARVMLDTLFGRGKRDDGFEISESAVAQMSIRHAVLYAASSGDVEIVRMLMERGFPVDEATAVRGRTALVIAAEGGFADVVRLLVEGLPEAVDGGDEGVQGGGEGEGGEEDDQDGGRDGDDREGEEDEIEDNKRAHPYQMTNEGDTPLWLAIIKNQRGVVREWAALGLGIEGIWAEDGRTALSLLCGSDKDVDGMVRLLLELGAEPDRKDEKGWAPMHYAVCSGRERNVQEMLSSGADPNMQTGDTKETAFDLAEKRGLVGMVKLLSNWRADSLAARASQFIVDMDDHWLDEPALLRWVSLGVDLNAADDSGWTALMISVQKNFLEMVELLLERGVQVNSQDEEGHTALWWAAWYGHVEVAKALLQAGADAELMDKSGKSLLSIATQRGWTELVDALLAVGAKEETKVTTDKPVSSSALSVDHHETSPNADFDRDAAEIPWRSSGEDIPDMVNDWFDQEHALFVVTTHGRVTTALLLLRLDTNVDCTNSSGQTPLMIAARKGDVPMIELLLDNEAQIELCNHHGQTALFEAAAWGQHDALQALLRRGANITTQDMSGMDPLMAGGHFGYEHVINALLDHGADLEAVDNKGRTALFHAARAGRRSVVQILLAKGAKVEKADKYGRTALLSAAQRGQLNVVKVLLENGASVSYSCKTEDKTALSLAAECGHESVSIILIQSGADINHRCGTGKTPLALASSGGHTMLVRVLIEHGARTDIPDNDGQTALTIAEKHGFSNVIQLLSRSLHHRSVSQLATRSNSLFYQYRPLSTETSVRLLELHPGTEMDILTFDLVEVNLDDSPLYETLSYEWGEKEGSVPVLCNGSYLLITPNLKRAMTKIRSTSTFRTLWIDAVCINQDDIPERNQQVSGMRRIFYEAKRTLIWIGDDTPMTEVGFKNAELLAEQHDIISQVPGWYPFNYNLYIDDKTYDTVLASWNNILSNPHSIKGLEDIFGRSYFTRAWIVQELLMTTRQGVVFCGAHSTDWQHLRKALWSIDFGSRYRLIDSFPHSNPHFRDILLIPRKYRHLQHLNAALNLSSEGRYLFWPMSTGLENLGPFATSDPRDKVYASTGFQSLQDKTLFPADYGLAVQEVYTNATRFALHPPRNAGTGVGEGLQNLAKYMRPYERHIPNLPSWVPDRSKPIWTHKPSTEFEVGHLIAAEIETTPTSLFVDAFITDTVAQVIHLTRDMAVQEACKLATLMLLCEHSKSILEPYPNLVNIPIPPSPPTNPPSQSPSPLITNLHAFWDTITPLDKAVHTPSRTRDILASLLDVFLTDKDIPTEFKDMLSAHRAALVEAGAIDLGKEDLFVEEYDWMEKMVWRGDVVITERGAFGITNAVGVAEKGMAVAVVGGADEVYLLRGRGGVGGEQGEGKGNSGIDSDSDGDGENGGETLEEGVGETEDSVNAEVETTGEGGGQMVGTEWYEFVDVVDMKHMRRRFESLEEVEEGASARIERLEIR